MLTFQNEKALTLGQLMDETYYTFLNLYDIINNYKYICGYNSHKKYLKILIILNKFCCNFI